MQCTESDVRVSVRTAYMPPLSNPAKDIYAFAYIIDIDNLSDSPVQLLRRYWLITNAQSRQTEVSGEGVVGQTPVLDAGSSFRYDSWACLDTPVGQMSGYYSMREISTGRFFNVTTPAFELICPQHIN